MNPIVFLELQLHSNNRVLSIGRYFVAAPSSAIKIPNALPAPPSTNGSSIAHQSPIHASNSRPRRSFASATDIAILLAPPSASNFPLTIQASLCDHVLPTPRASPSANMSSLREHISIPRSAAPTAISSSSSAFCERFSSHDSSIALRPCPSCALSFSSPFRAQLRLLRVPAPYRVPDFALSSRITSRAARALPSWRITVVRGMVSNIVSEDEADKWSDYFERYRSTW